MNQFVTQKTRSDILSFLRTAIVITLSLVSYSCNPVAEQSEHVVITPVERFNSISLDKTDSTPISTLTNYVLPPDRNRLEMAKRLLRNPTAQQILERPSTPQQIGRTSQFWVMENWNLQSGIIEANLVAVSDNFYWYFEDQTQYSEHQLETTIQIVEEKILPTLIKVLGGSWSPGPDKDPRLTVLNAEFAGPAGYFAASNQYSKFVHTDSNERAMIYLNQIEQAPFGSLEYISTLTHELQHAIHWAKDPTEEAWVNEGLSEVIKTIFGYPLSFTNQFESSQTPTSLNFWPTESEPLGPYYGSSTRFFEYFISHYGGTGILGDLLALDQDGIYGINSLLEQMGYSETFDDVFENWIIANALDLPNGIHSYPDTEISQFRATSNLKTSTPLTGQIPQYAAQYISFEANSSSILYFEGETKIPVLPTKLVTPFCWWSNRGDSINTSLTRSFDLTDVENPSLKLTIWYEIEKGWDYAYVEVSEENESNWNVIRGNKYSETKTTRNSFGPGYSGSSNGWVTDEFNLSEYSGKKISLRIEYVTDEGLHGSGLCLASVSIPEIDYDYSAKHPGSWHSNGFVFTDNRVEQNYSVQVILFTKPIQVLKLKLDGSNKGAISLPKLGSDYVEGMVVIAPMNHISSESPSYTVGFHKSTE